MNAKTNIVWWCCARNCNRLCAQFRSWMLLRCLLWAAAAAIGADARADLAYAWGYNGSGQLGDGTTTQRDAPIAVPGLSSGVTSIAGGQYFSLGLQNGAVYAWGSNDSGQLGNAIAEAQSTSPAPVIGLSSGVTAIACGWRHGLALQNGGVYTWGYPGAPDFLTPVAVPGLASGVTAIAGGGRHSMAVQNGGLYSWGNNSLGQLGIGSSTTQNGPVYAVTGMSSGVTSIACGYLHSLAVQNGAAYAWGYNNFGEVGDGTTTNRDTPFALPGLSSGVTSIAGGFDHSLAVRNGGVFAWGGNGSGQLGDGTTIARSTPEQIDPADLRDIISVAAGDSSSYALSSDGSLWVWGYNLFGELGLGNESFDDLTPQHLLPPGGYRFTSIDADGSGFHAVATLAAVPEPGSLSLISIAVGVLFRRRRA